MARMETVLRCSLLLLDSDSQNASFTHSFPNGSRTSSVGLSGPKVRQFGRHCGPPNTCTSFAPPGPSEGLRMGQILILAYKLLVSDKGKYTALLVGTVFSSS
jgi:hypothetical protein